MKVVTLVPLTVVMVVLVMGESKDDMEEGAMEILSDYEGSGRVFPLLPPYQAVDFATNFNKLKSSGDTAYFVVRDSIVVSTTWYV